MATSTLISADEFEKLSRDSDARLEFMDGEVIELSSPRPEHSFIVLNLIETLRASQKKNRFGRWIFGSEFFLSPERRVIPDLALIRQPSLLLLDPRQTPISVLPDLVVEVISPNEMARDVEQKVSAYLEAGVLEVWTLYSESKHVYLHHANTSKRLGIDDVLESSVLPGWSCPVSDIFEI